MSLNVKIVVGPDGMMPTRATEGSAGFDLYASRNTYIHSDGIATELVPTDVRIEIPPGYFGLVRPRSGLARLGVTLCSSGVVDSDYRGELLVNLINHSQSDRYIAKGDRIAQILFIPYYAAEFKPVEALTPSGRGEGGFGHTGK
jgi:dUTP pyrophosphatase